MPHINIHFGFCVQKFDQRLNGVKFTQQKLYENVQDDIVIMYSK